MPRYTAGCLSTAGSTTLPLAALVGSTTAPCKIREVGVFNTTTTALNVELSRLDGTTAGTSGTSATSRKYDIASANASGVLKSNYSSTAPTVLTDLGYRASLGAAIGAGVIWTFGDTGLIVPATTNAAVCVIVESGSGQICEIYFVWDE